MKNQGIVNKICQRSIIIVLPIALMLTILQVYVFRVNFYLESFQEYNVSTTTGIDIDGLEIISTNLIDYLKDNKNNLDFQVKINGTEKEVFGQREKKHMEDVKVLFEKGFILKNTSIFLTISALLILYKRGKKKEILKGLNHACIVSLVVMILLLIMMKVDFLRYFTYFHKIFFTNDLWLLNPKTDLLIQMLPLEFFVSISTRVIIWFIVVMTSIGLTSFYGLRNKTLKESIVTKKTAV